MSGCLGNLGKWLQWRYVKVRLMRKRVDMAKVRVRKEFRLLEENWGNGYSEST